MGLTCDENAVCASCQQLVFVLAAQTATLVISSTAIRKKLSVFGRIIPKKSVQKQSKLALKLIKSPPITRESGKKRCVSEKGRKEELGGTKEF